VWSEIRKIYACREVIWNLTSHELKAAHRHKLLGNLWALLDPLLMMLVLFFVFSGLRKMGYDYALYIFSGLIAWEFFARNLLNATNCIRRQKSLIYKVPIPMGVFPIATMLRQFNDFLWGLVAFIFMKFFSEAPLESYFYILLFPLLFFFFCMFTLGISFIIASLGVFFLDIVNIMGVLIRLGFFLNPVFWPMEWLPWKLESIYLTLNPIGGFLVLFRSTLLQGSPEAFQIQVPYYLFYLSLISISTLVVGFRVFQKGQGHYAKYV